MKIKHNFTQSISGEYTPVDFDDGDARLALVVTPRVIMNEIMQYILILQHQSSYYHELCTNIDDPIEDKPAYSAINTAGLFSLMCMSRLIDDYFKSDDDRGRDDDTINLSNDVIELIVHSSTQLIFSILNDTLAQQTMAHKICNGGSFGRINDRDKLNAKHVKNYFYKISKRIDKFEFLTMSGQFDTPLMNDNLGTWQQPIEILDSKIMKSLSDKIF